jgi:serine/threonine protein kinase/formylglycine-generating enzyme required for sulfatase activity
VPGDWQTRGSRAFAGWTTLNRANVQDVIHLFGCGLDIPWNGLILAARVSARTGIAGALKFNCRFQRMAESLEFEHYQLLTNSDGSLMELGRGTMGVTYKAFDKNLYCYVALKVIAASLLDSENAAERFLREARVAARLRHRNVASVFHLGKHGDSYFYAMEFIDGETVYSRVKREGPVDCVFGLDIAQQVACALIAAEEQQLVHRDIKPSNLMLVRESDGEILAKVIDFGLVKSAVAESSSAGHLTVRGFVGTPYFASPEQLDRQAEDIRSDIYSLGVTLWYMLTGKPTFMGSMASVIAQHLEKTPAFDSLAILPAQVVAVLRRMLEKDKTKRIQTPWELRLELRSCIESLSAPQPATRPETKTKDTFETIELTSVRTPEVRPEAGSVLKNRYRLIEDVNPANPGHIFHAEDTLTRMRVTVRIFLTDPSILAEIDEEAERVKSSTHPNFIQLFAVERERNISFIVLEWLEGFPLVDLLRARRALTLREMLMLLQQIAPAVDAARAGHLNLEMKLREIFLHFPESFAEPVANVVLRCPLDEWPAFVVKMSLLEKIRSLEAASAVPVQEQTIITDLKPQRDVVQLGILSYELLGGKPGGFAPLATVSEKGNEVLRKCLTPDRSFSTAAEFYDALRGVANAKSEPVGKVTKQPGPERRISPRPENSADASAAGAVPTQSLPPFDPLPVSKSYFWPIAGALTAILLLVGAVWLFLPAILNPTLNESPQVLNEINSPKTNPAFGSHPPPQPGKPWTNSLDMHFVPLGDIYISEWQTRRADFEAFVQATGYDAVGGMSSAVTENGFKLNEMSWKSPGFQQTADHPVVGVSWEDANQFCAWLTKKERNEGTLATFQSYRLPTDREWSQAVGLEHEQGSIPRDRSGKIKGVYPWGDGFPPPNDSANYAGSESRVDAPDTWSVIPGFHDAFPRTAPVSAFKANARGLCCIGGNVWEWCMDKFENTMNWRTLRGGSWATSRAEEMLSSHRRGYGPLFRRDDIGFRCVLGTDGAHE